jgi:hypothetical protein
MPRSMLVGLLAAASLPIVALAQSSGTPAIDLPNRFAPAASFGQLPSGQACGGTTAVAVDADGKSIWVFERCGAES